MTAYIAPTGSSRLLACTLAACIAVAASMAGQGAIGAPAEDGSAPEIQAAPLAEQDLQVLLRIGQLAQWLGEDVTPEVGLCIVSTYAMRWPDAQGPATDREEEAMQQARESCARATVMPTSSSTTTLRLVAGAREEFQLRMARLHGPLMALQKCSRAQLSGANLDQCLRQVAGRPLTPIEQRWALVSAAAYRPAKSACLGSVACTSKSVLTP